MTLKRILICPMDWGLGHATRCMPVIDELVRQGNRLYLASSGPALELLRKEYPQLQHFEMDGYRPVYKSRWFAFSMLVQIPHFLMTIRKEHIAVRRLVAEHQIDLVISDNRYGCWSPAVPSVFITHQVSIKAGLMSGIVNRANRRFIRKFSACWIPDVPGISSLAGELAGSENLNAVFIGHLSRFHVLPSLLPVRYDIVAIASGPEPQRTLLENLMRDQLRPSGLKYLLIKGLPEKPAAVLTEDATEIDHLPAPVMNKVLQQTKMVVSRSGYSTIMDLATLGAKAIFIPTPGQTEQEYLAGRLMKSGVAFMMEQNAFNIGVALERSVSYTGFGVAAKNDLLRDAIAKLPV